ncbi:MAG: glycosyltransferase family A protein [Candidatus Saccharimonadales bacterium]
MTLALIYFAVTAGLELLVMSSLRLGRQLTTDSLSVFLVITAGLIVYEQSNLAAILVAILMLYRVINLARLTHRQHQLDYVQHLARRASVVLIGLQTAVLLVGALYSLDGAAVIVNTPMLLGISLLSLAISGVLAHTIDRQGRVTLPVPLKAFRPDSELPSLTVAIPARNETADLEACLTTLTHSSYPKLEILVLDDCSQNPHTPQVIRQFAHDGVRFIAGTSPPPNWLAKNHAYAQLADAANGELILFCGVDARFEPNALQTIVETLLNRQKTMLSVMPRNLVPARFKLEAMLVQPGRYAWELVLPRRWLDRPPVLSSLWLIRSQTLQDAGGLAAVHRAILPERYFARFSALNHDGYSFLQGGQLLGVSSAKSFSEQKATAIRTRYPSLHRRVELTAVVSLIELAMLVMPYVALVSAAVARQWLIVIVLSATCLLLNFTYYQVVRMTYQQRLLRGLWLMPFAALYDVALLNYSLFMYEFRKVIWKGRNVCIPVMRVIPRLPRLEPAFNQRSGRHHKRRHRHGRHH